MKNDRIFVTIKGPGETLKRTGSLRLICKYFPLTESTIRNYWSRKKTKIYIRQVDEKLYIVEKVECLSE